MSVVLYVTPGIGQVQTATTRRALQNLNIEFEEFDTSVNEDALAAVEVLGYLQRSVVITDDDHWSGFRHDKIAELPALEFIKHHPNTDYDISDG